MTSLADLETKLDAIGDAMDAMKMILEEETSSIPQKDEAGIERNSVAIERLMEVYNSHEQAEGRFLLGTHDGQHLRLHRGVNRCWFPLRHDVGGDRD